jgi:hypothetical protein
MRFILCNLSSAQFPIQGEHGCERLRRRDRRSIAQVLLLIAHSPSTASASSPGLRQKTLPGEYGVLSDSYCCRSLLYGGKGENVEAAAGGRSEPRQPAACGRHILDLYVNIFHSCCSAGRIINGEGRGAFHRNRYDCAFPGFCPQGWTGMGESIPQT